LLPTLLFPPVNLNTKHGFAPKHKKRHPVYAAWKSMRGRCSNKNSKDWKNYGGRGITVSDEWSSFENFLRDMMPNWKQGLMLERLDNSKGYSKENCKWATRTEQNRNRRNSHLVTFNGQTKTLSEWREQVGGNRDILYVRLSRGWTIEQALTIPPGQQRPQFNGRWARA